VKLLFDQNLASRLVARLKVDFPDSAHVRDLGLRDASDQQVWEHARVQGFTIVSKDWDFQQLSFVRGSPPKVIWIRRGNCSVKEVEELLRSKMQDIQRFGDDPEAALLILS
jgi:predicted nuclease of predicted toxin-antitoxin system